MSSSDGNDSDTVQFHDSDDDQGPGVSVRDRFGARRHFARKKLNQMVRDEAPKFLDQDAAEPAFPSTKKFTLQDSRGTKTSKEMAVADNSDDEDTIMQILAARKAKAAGKKPKEKAGLAMFVQDKEGNQFSAAFVNDVFVGPMEDAGTDDAGDPIKKRKRGKRYADLAKVQKQHRAEADAEARAVGFAEGARIPEGRMLQTMALESEDGDIGKALVGKRAPFIGGGTAKEGSGAPALRRFHNNESTAEEVKRNATMVGKFMQKRRAAEKAKGELAPMDSSAWARSQVRSSSRPRSAPQPPPKATSTGQDAAPSTTPKASTSTVKKGGTSAKKTK